jgi:hypothetical protein
LSSSSTIQLWLCLLYQRTGYMIKIGVIETSESSELLEKSMRRLSHNKLIKVTCYRKVDGQINGSYLYDLSKGY